MSQTTFGGALRGAPPSGQADTASNAPAGGRAGGLLRVVSNSELDARAAQDQQDAEQAKAKPAPTQDIAAFVRSQWNIFRNHRNTGEDSINSRLLRAQRMFEGKYDPDKLAQIRKFGGSQVYSRLVAVKCRGATSLLRDVYLGPDRPWDITPEPDPDVPPEIVAQIGTLVGTEVQNQAQAGVTTSADQVHMRTLGLMHAAQQAARRAAMGQAANACDKIDDILVEGRFYDALAAFLIDLPLFPFACLKGPVVRMVPKLVWQDGRATRQDTAQMFWERISPFDLYYTPGVSNIADADVIQRGRLTRSDLNDLIGLPGYDDAAIRAALDDYGRGLRDWLDSTDTEQAVNEGRENPTMNQSNMIDTLEYHGQVQGRMLIQGGMDPALIDDELRDYGVQTWVVGRHTIKTQLNPSPRQRHPFYLTSFEKCPGTVHGHGLPDLLEDLQEICNASLRSAVNNMSIASGPQVVVNDEALSPNENGDELYPWKVWHMQSDPMGNAREPVTFFQPKSNVQELFSVYTQASNIADEISAIPRYITGSSQGLGGAGRTASGLSMLMGNAEKVLQTVAANVDNDIMQPLLLALYDMIMLTDQSGLLTGDEDIRVRGVNVAVQKETERSKQLQFLQITANPIDGPIIGQIGRARVLRAVAAGLGLPDDVVPDDKTLQGQIDAQKQMQNAASALQSASGNDPNAPPGTPGNSAPHPSGHPGPGGAPKPGTPPSPGAAAQGGQAPAAPMTSHSDIAPPVNLMQQGLPK